MTLITVDNTQKKYSSVHEVRPINDLFRPHDSIHPVVSLTAVQVFFFR